MDLFSKIQNNALNSLVVVSIVSTILVASLPGGNFINQAITGAMILSVVGLLVSTNRRLWLSPELLVILVWITYAIIPSITSVNPEKSIFRLISIFLILFFVISLIQASMWKEGIRLFIWTYIGSMCASYIITFTELNEYIKNISVGVIGAGETIRTASTLGNAVTFGVAAVLAQSLIVLLASLPSTTKIEKLLGLGAYVVLTGAIINSGSRTAMGGSIALLVGMIWVFGVLNPRNILKSILWLGLIIGLLGTAAYKSKDIDVLQERYYEIIEKGTTLNRITDFFNMFAMDDGFSVSSVGDSLGDRMDLGVIAWETFNQHPFGVGLDNFSEIAGVHAHSNYLELLASTGFIGVFLYYIFYFLILLRATKMWLKFPRFKVPKAVIVGMLVLAVTDIQNVSYYVKTVWVYLALLISTLEIFRRQANARYQFQ